MSSKSFFVTLSRQCIFILRLKKLKWMVIKYIDLKEESKYALLEEIFVKMFFISMSTALLPDRKFKILRILLLAHSAKRLRPRFCGANNVAGLVNVF